MLLYLQQSDNTISYTPLFLCLSLFSTNTIHLSIWNSNLYCPNVNEGCPKAITRKGVKYVVKFIFLWHTSQQISVTVFYNYSCIEVEMCIDIIHCMYETVFMMTCIFIISNNQSIPLYHHITVIFIIAMSLVYSI